MFSIVVIALGSVICAGYVLVSILTIKSLAGWYETDPTEGGIKL